MPHHTTEQTQTSSPQNTSGHSHSGAQAALTYASPTYSSGGVIQMAKGKGGKSAAKRKKTGPKPKALKKAKKEPVSKTKMPSHKLRVRKISKRHVKAATSDKDGQKFVQAVVARGFVEKKKIHQSHLFTGKKDNAVPANPHMSQNRLLVRHIATALLSQNNQMIEVQVAISNAQKIVYVACNTKETSLHAMLPQDGEMSSFSVPADSAEDHPRIARHKKKLKAELPTALNGYKIEFIQGLADQHAETKIVDAGVDFDYIGGTRRPCAACFAYLQSKGISPDKFNSHHGSFWDAQAALMSLRDKDGHIDQKHIDAAEKLSDQFHHNQGAANEQEKFDFDTDSEDESDALSAE